MTSFILLTKIILLSKTGFHQNNMPVVTEQTFIKGKQQLRYSFGFLEFNVETLNDRFDHKIAVLQLRYIVSKIADLD